MGIAWFEDEAPESEEPELRIGGEPLLPSEAAWPTCPRCAHALLFRAQVPLALTSLVPFDDDRLLVVFECHARHGACGGATALIVGGDLELRRPPEPPWFDVMLVDLGASPDHVRRVLEALDAETRVGWVLRDVPRSIAEQATLLIEGAGGKAALRPTPPTCLQRVSGGRLVPFEEGFPGTRQTTLPPLTQLMDELRRTPMRGLFGGTTPGYRDHTFTCHCGAPTRTALRLLGHDEPDPSGASLRAATIQVCTRCMSGSVLRTGGGVPSRPVVQARC